MRIVIFTVLILIALYVAAIAFLAINQRHFIYPGAVRPMPPAPVPPTSAAIVIETADGERLHALWRPPAPGCGVVVSFHGNGSRPEPHAARFGAGVWADAGWGMLAPAYRGYPGSTGNPSEDGLIRDGLAAVATVRSRAPGAPILLHGHSLGAAVAVAVAEREPAIGLYLEAPFDAMAHVVRLHAPLFPSWLLRDTYRSDRRIRAGTGPVLIVQGRDDTVIPPKLALALARAAGKRARFALIPGDHGSILGVRDREAEALFGERVGSVCAPSRDAAR